MSRRAWALFALPSVVWGGPYLMIKVAAAEVSVPFLVFARSAVGAAVLFPIAFRDRGFAPLRGHLIPVASSALVEMIVPWGLLTHGEVRLNSSTAGLLGENVAAQLRRRQHARRRRNPMPALSSANVPVSPCQ